MHLVTAPSSPVMCSFQEKYLFSLQLFFLQAFQASLQHLVLRISLCTYVLQATANETNDPRDIVCRCVAKSSLKKKSKSTEKRKVVKQKRNSKIALDILREESNVTGIPLQSERKKKKTREASKV